MLSEERFLLRIALLKVSFKNSANSLESLFLSELGKLFPQNFLDARSLQPAAFLIRLFYTEKYCTLLLVRRRLNPTSF